MNSCQPLGANEFCFRRAARVFLFVGTLFMKSNTTHETVEFLPRPFFIFLESIFQNSGKGARARAFRGFAKRSLCADDPIAQPDREASHLACEGRMPTT